jgi:predicted transcriptional regulator
MMSEGAEMIRTQIQLPEDTMRAIKRLAAQRKTSIAALVREAVEALVTGQRVASADDRRARARAAAGRFRSGRGDLSLRHDACFAEVAEP